MTPEEIADRVLAHRYGSPETFTFAMDTDPAGLDAIAIRAMLKEAAVLALSAATCDACEAWEAMAEASA